MPELKVFLDDTLLTSTPVNFQQATPRIKPRNVTFGKDEIKTIEGRITKEDLRQVFEPEIEQRYYYIKDRKIKEGTYYGYADELTYRPYMMLKDEPTNDSIMDFVDAVYKDKNDIDKTTGGKRKSRRNRKSKKSRKTNKRRK